MTLFTEGAGSLRRLRAPLSRRRFLGGMAAWVAALVAGCTTRGRRATRGSTAGSAKSTASVAPVTTTTGRTLRVAYVAELTGVTAARGELVRASLDAMTGYLADKQGGLWHGVRPVLVPVDAAASGADPAAVFSRLTAENVNAVVWCAPGGLAQNVASVAALRIPVISVFADVFTNAPDQGSLSGPGANGSFLFQTALPEAFALDVLMAYAAEDRGFASTALVFDETLYPGIDRTFAAAATRRGLAVRGTFGYQPAPAGAPDLAGPLNSLKAGAGVHALVCYGAADQVSSIAAHLVDLDAQYRDTPTTKRSHFRPMLMGSRWATGDVDFPRLAGDAAARGTMATTGLGSVVALPALPMRTWLHDYVPSYNGGFPRGGEDGPADAVAALLAAAGRAGSTEPAALVAALQDGTPSTFASTVSVSFAPDRHLAPTRDHVALLTLEYPPEPFNLGNEWRDVLPHGYQGPTHLVDFTLAANLRAQADVALSIVQRRFGTSATDDAQGGLEAKVAACRALH